MKYDFTSIIDRRGLDAKAVDIPNAPGGTAPRGETKPEFANDRIPMWIADMNFPTAPSVIEAIEQRLKHPLFGYFDLRQEYFDAIIDWQRKRNGVTGLKPEHIGYENGVLGGVVSAMNVLCSRGGSVLVHAPTYVGFTNSLVNNGYDLVLSELKLDDQGIWRMDFDDMERKIHEKKIHAAIFCNPHNPTGRVWEHWELERAMELYKANDVFVISDEIWSDIILEGYKHIPVQSVSDDARDRTIALYSLSKTFSLAGLVGSYHVIYNKYLRERIEKESSLSHYNSANVLSMYSLIGGYKLEGQEWLDELIQVLTDNVNYAYDFICEHFKGVSTVKPQGTYMLFLNCEEWCRVHNKTIDELQQAGIAAGVLWQDGRPFHGAYGIRMNLALPHSRLVEAFNRLDKYVFN